MLAMQTGKLWLGASLLALAASAAGQPAPPTGARQYEIPLMLPASHATAEGFVRIVNLSDESGEVRVVAVDDTGRRFGPISFSLAAGAVKHFNSGDLERGNPGKGLSGGVGDGTGSWRLEIASSLELDPLAFVRTSDGFLTAMHGKVHQDEDLAIFNPGGNRNQRSRLRLVNRAGQETEVVIRGVDDAGQVPNGEVRLTLAAGEARDVSAVQLETGDRGISGRLGDGSGKWRLSVAADGPIWAMNLLQSPNDYVANLTSNAGAELAVPFFLSASDEHGRQGFARIRNRSDRDGAVRIHAFDDDGIERGPVTLSLDAGETVHFNSTDLETGNAGKGLPGGVGRGRGNWRLQFDTDLAIDAMAYVRHDDGFLTSMHDVAVYSNRRHRIPIFNPASNARQRSLLRLANPSDGTVRVTIAGVDDTGASPGTEVSLNLPARAARTLSAVELEQGVAGLVGRLGDGAGKWRLAIDADGPLYAMSLLESPTGHLSNLSLPARGEPVTLAVSVFGAGEVAVAGLPDALECSAFDCRGVFEAGTRLVLEASPEAGRDTEWNDCGHTDGDRCEVWLDEDRLVFAAFQSQEPLALAENVIVLSAEQLEGLTNVQESSLIFREDTPGAGEWTRGDVLLSEGVADVDDDDLRSEPFARRIEHIEGTYIFRTEPASLEDLFESGSYSSSAQTAVPTPAWVPPVPGTVVAEGVRYVGLSPKQPIRKGISALSHRFEVAKNIVVRSAATSTADTLVETERVWIGGHFDLGVDRDLHFDRSPFEVRLAARPWLQTQLRARVQGGLPLRHAQTLRRQPLPPFTVPVPGIPIPILINPELVLQVVVEAAVGAQVVSPTVTLGTTATAGFHYIKGEGITPLYAFTLDPNEIDIGTLALHFDAKAEVGLDARLNLRVMARRGPHVYGRAGPYLGAQKCPWGDYVDLYGGARLAAGGELAILSRRFSAEVPLLDRRRPLGSVGLGAHDNDALFDGLVAGLAVTPGVEKLTIAWDRLEGQREDCGVSYNIYRDGRKIASHWPRSSFVDTGLDAENRYSYEISVNLPSGRESPRTEPIAGRPLPDSTFRDCLEWSADGRECIEYGPLMMPLPTGSFMMGSPPHHRVTIDSPFAMGVYEVTHGEFARFVDATDWFVAARCPYYRYPEPRSRGDGGGIITVSRQDAWRVWRNGTSAHPVVCVGQPDGVAYAEWLSDVTGERYRLPSEAEWEYAARAGSPTQRHWGNSVAEQCLYANGSDASWGVPVGDDVISGTFVDCNDGFRFTAPVGTFLPNAWGLYDILGNATEYVADCWNESHDGAPADGVRRTDGDCSKVLPRGGSWSHGPDKLHSAYREGWVRAWGWPSTGFRVVKDL